MVKHGLRSLLDHPPAIFERNRNIKFHFNTFHGFGKLDRAIDLLEQEVKMTTTKSGNDDSKKHN